MTAWLCCQRVGESQAIRAKQPTHLQAVGTLRNALLVHQAQGHSIDPPDFTGQLEHRYAVTAGEQLIAVYWVSTGEAA